MGLSCKIYPVLLAGSALVVKKAKQNLPEGVI